MAERTYGNFEDAEGTQGYTRDDIAEMTSEDKVRMMVEWFHAHFEDPAERTLYEFAEGGYQWIWGGPHSADEEVQDEFSEVVDFDTMQEAVREIESDGLCEWAPKEDPDDYEDFDAYDSVLAGDVVDGNGEWPPVVPVDMPSKPEPEARRDLVHRLNELEELIRPLIANKPMIGHNNPPEATEVEYPCSRHP